MPCKVGSDQSYTNDRKHGKKIVREVVGITPFENFKEEPHHRDEQANSEQDGTRLTDKIFGTALQMRDWDEITSERNGAEQRGDQLIDFDQRTQQSRSNKNQRCAKRGGNTKTEFHVVRFPEQTG